MVAKFYPDWAKDHTCKNDNNEPQYMVLNPTMWLLDSLESCCKFPNLFNRPVVIFNPSYSSSHTTPESCVCVLSLLIQGKKYFSWQLSECMQEGDAVPSILYYPDWAGLNKGCINDGTF
jgi:hypothetical protein